jgi:DNA-binding NarL/FixJ family response regulator
VSLDRPRSEEDEDGELVDAFGSEDHGYAVAEDAATVERLMRVLSEREREVLRLLAAGVRTKDIAEQLVVTAATVSTHIQRIMSKTGTSSRAELLALAAREASPDAR